MSEIKVEGLDLDLYPHQLSSVYHLERREQTKKILTGAMEITSNVGLFSDIGGSGKTLSLVALIARDRIDWNLEEPYARASVKYTDPNGSVAVKRFRIVSDIKCTATLVVVQSNVVNQWTEELGRSVLSFKEVATKQSIFDCDFDIDTLDVIVCSHCMYQTFVTRFPRVWKRVIFDDPVALDISKMHSIDAGFIWFVTDATLFADCFRRRRVATRHFIKTLFGRMPSDVFQSLVVKNNDSYVMKSWPLLPPVRVVYSCTKKEGPLNGDIETIEAMGGVIKDDDSLFEKETCPICLEQHSSDVIYVKCCRKKFGGGCLVRWFEEEEKGSETCPHCRCSLNGEDLVFYVTNRRRTRNSTVVNIIKSSSSGKFILFSMVRDHLRAIRSLLNESGITSASLQGGLTDSKTIANFRGGGLKVLFLSAKQNGVGLNLEFATDLILYHEVPPSIEAVLVSRAHRIGRRLAEPLRVHHLKLS